MQEESFDPDKFVDVLKRAAGQIFTDSEIARFAGLLGCDPGALRAIVTDSLVLHLGIAITGPHPRFADIRRDVSRVEKTAREASTALRSFNAAFNETPDAHAALLLRRGDPRSEIRLPVTASLADSLDVLSRAAGTYAEVLKVRGRGRPKMLALSGMINALVRGVIQASNRKPSLWFRPDLGEWRGPLFELVRSALDRLSDLASSVSAGTERMFGQRVKIPIEKPVSREALGQYLRAAMTQRPKRKVKRRKPSGKSQ